MSEQRVAVVGAPGYVDRFTASLLLNNFPAVDDRGDLAVVSTEVGELHVVPASTVHPLTDGEYER